MNLLAEADRIPRSYALATSLLAVLLAAAGCQKAADNATETAIEASSGHRLDVERDGGTTILRGEDGAEARISTGDGLQLPDGFPDDVYLPGEYTLSSVAEMGPMTMVQLSSSAAVETLSEDIDKTMQAEGWQQVMAMHQASGSAVLSYEKGARRASFTLSSGASDRRTLVGVQLQKKG